MPWSSSGTKDHKIQLRPLRKYHEIHENYYCKCQTIVVGYTVSTYKRIRMFEIHNKEHVVARLADDLVEMHNATAIELEYWETARLLVEHYYDVKTIIVIGAKK